MKKYKVEITETLQKVVEVLAFSEGDAIEQVRNSYSAEDIILDDTAYIDTEFNIYNYDEDETRKCSDCGKDMTEGYCIENGLEYYCSEKCLHKHYSEQKYLDLYDNGNGDSYYTKWEE